MPRSWWRGWNGCRWRSTSRAFCSSTPASTPTPALAGSTPDELVYIRTWPPTGGIEGPRWHDHLPPGGKLIVFGHDAPRGLVVKRPPGAGPGVRPYLIGLDSACVFGGHLSAYLLEEDRILQVPAQRPWFRNVPP